MLSVGSQPYRFEVVEAWPRLPAGWDLVEVAAVATDSQDRVYLFNRGECPVAIFSPDGEFVSHWGEQTIVRAHGLTVGPDDSVYCVDDLDHTVMKFSPDGELLLKLGVSGQYSDTGATSLDYRTIQRSGPPFNFPTDLALGGGGELYITDGYGNARVHKFSPDGELLKSWGEPGDGPGQFHVPHGIAVSPDGLVWVADRENDRIQRFDANGAFVDEWTQLARPTNIFIDNGIDGAGAVYVSELGYHAGIWPGSPQPSPNATGGRVSIFNLQGELLCRWGGGKDPCARGDFFAPHDLWLDSRGDLYVSEVHWSAGGKRGLVPRACHCIQKFVREYPAK
jgi:DNA-binding beta-propeller fold protein YncE